MKFFVLFLTKYILEYTSNMKKFNILHIRWQISYFRPNISVLVEVAIPEVLSRSVTYKIYLVCVESEKYTFWVTLRPIGFMR